MMKVKRYGSDNEIELLPCPFCGSDRQVVYTFCGSDPQVVYTGNDLRESRAVTIQCSNSGCRISRTDRTLRKTFSWLEDIAVNGWNMRVNTCEFTEEELQAEAKAQREEDLREYETMVIQGIGGNLR